MGARHEVGKIPRQGLPHQHWQAGSSSLLPPGANILVASSPVGATYTSASTISKA